MTSKGNVKEKQRVGRPTKYKAIYAREAYTQCREYGYTHKDLAKYFKVTTSTITEWVKNFPEFSAQVKSGKDHFDTERVEASLLKRALGYEYEERKIILEGEGEKRRIEKTVKQFPPDVTAIIFWLTNRKPEIWKDRRNLYHKLEDADESDLSKIPTKRLLQMAGMTKPDSEEVSAGGNGGKRTKTK